MGTNIFERNKFYLMEFFMSLSWSTINREKLHKYIKSLFEEKIIILG